MLGASLFKLLSDLGLRFMGGTKALGAYLILYAEYSVSSRIWAPQKVELVFCERTRVI